MNTASDNELMSRFQKGETDKIGILYERHKEGLFAYFYRCTNDRGKSEDLVQNVFIRIIKYRSKFSGKGQFVYWLYTIARNTWLAEYRKNEPLNAVIELNGTTAETLFREDHVELDETDDRKSQLKIALQKISPEKRDAIVLSRYHGLTYKTIAEMSDCTENAIKARVMRGIVEIRQAIQAINTE